MPSACPVLSETPGEIKWAGPLLGEHNEDVFKNMLGFTEDQYAQLLDEGII